MSWTGADGPVTCVCVCAYIQHMQRHQSLAMYAQSMYQCSSTHSLCHDNSYDVISCKCMTFHQHTNTHTHTHTHMRTHTHLQLHIVWVWVIIVGKQEHPLACQTHRTTVRQTHTRVYIVLTYITYTVHTYTVHTYTVHTYTVHTYTVHTYTVHNIYSTYIYDTTTHTNVHCMTISSYCRGSPLHGW